VTQYRAAVDGTQRRYCAISRNQPRNKVSVLITSLAHQAMPVTKITHNFEQHIL